MKIRVDVNKRHAISVGLFVLLVALGIFVVAYGGDDAQKMGHTASEVDIQTIANEPSSTKELGNFLRQDVCRKDPIVSNNWTNCPPDSLLFCTSPSSPGSCVEGESIVGDQCCRIVFSDDLREATIEIGYDNSNGGGNDCWTLNGTNIGNNCVYWDAGSTNTLPPTEIFPPQSWCVNEAFDWYNSRNIGGQTGGWVLMNWQDTGQHGYPRSGDLPCSNTGEGSNGDFTSDRIRINMARYTP